MRTCDRSDKLAVLVLGEINKDLIACCERMPREGETLHAEDLKTAAGGKGANAAVACSRLGVRTFLVGRVGSDDLGRSLRESLLENGVDTSGVGTDSGSPSGVALILLEAGGKNRIIAARGANARVGHEEVAAACRLLASVSAVHMSLGIPVETVVAVARAARAKGVLSVLDAGPPAPLPAELFALVDVISPNQTEAEMLTGVTVTGAQSARSAAERLIQMGAREVVIKLGGQGAYWLGPGGEKFALSFPISPVDTTAAGDSFTACLTVSLARGLPMPVALERANAAGALACLRMGAQPSMPSSQELERFLAERVGP